MSERIRVLAEIGGPSLTRQADALESDVNQIVRRYVAHGIMPPGGGGVPRYGDFSDSMSYHDALTRVRDMESDFMALPAAVRDYCRNDPGEFLTRVMDPASTDDLRELGLLEEQRPAIVEPVEPLAAPGAAPLEPPVTSGT